MQSAYAQSTNAVLMIRPSCFYPNPETAADNTFQRDADLSEDALTRAAQTEFDNAVEALRSAGVNVNVFQDGTDPKKPDAVFPNNWISTHEDGRVVLYPMYSASRRGERRADIVDELRRFYRVTEVIDYSRFESENCFLEGTGSLVLDRVNQIAYVSLSNRSNARLIRRFSEDFAYEPVVFASVDSTGAPIYHTNVMMCVGTEFAMVSLELIPDESEREQVRTKLKASGKEIVDLSAEQIENFAGNAIELESAHGEKLLVLSARAHGALTHAQRNQLARYVRFIPLDLPTIELGGGSARCMIAEIHLPPL